MIHSSLLSRGIGRLLDRGVRLGLGRDAALLSRARSLIFLLSLCGACAWPGHARKADLCCAALKRCLTKMLSCG